MANDTPTDRNELFIRYLARHEGSVRAFVASLLDDWYGVDEVMQSASIVMWRKFDDFDTGGPEETFLHWALMIARYEVLKYRSKRARDRLVFSDDVYELLEAEASAVAASQSDRDQALQHCLTKLAPAQRELIRVAYASGLSIKEAAQVVGRSPTAFYKALARIRDSLHRCIERRLAEPDTGRIL